MPTNMDQSESLGPSRVRVTVRLDASFKAILEEQARKERRDLSSHMEHMLERWYRYSLSQANRGKGKEE